VIDVSNQRHIKPPSSTDTSTDRRLIHVLELPDNVLAHQPFEYPLPQTKTRQRSPSPLDPAQVTGSDRPWRRPAVVYYRRRDARRGVGVLELVPALTALRDGERCAVTGGDPDGLFTVVSGLDGRLSSLQFARSTIDVGVYRFALTCRPIANHTHQKPFEFDVELHLH